MPRPCTVCLHPQLPEVSIDLANGVSDVQIASTTVWRDRACSGITDSRATRTGKSSARPTLNSAATPSAGAGVPGLGVAPLGGRSGGGLFLDRRRIDVIATKAEHQGSLAIALMGLKELRATVTAQAALAGHSPARPCKSTPRSTSTSAKRSRR